jgi:hypothetical protein
LKAPVSIGVLREQAIGREKLLVQDKTLEMLERDDG